MNEEILVTGATGTQGGAVVVALLAAGFSVRALVRPGRREEATALEARGARIAWGDLDSAESLQAAASGVRGVFSVQLADPTGQHREVQRAARLLAALGDGVTSLVQSLVSGTGAHAAMPGWTEGRWPRAYWEDKAAVQDLVRQSGVAHFAILKPAMMMENFLPPKSLRMHPELARGIIAANLGPDTPVAFVAAESIAAAAVAAFAEPIRFAGAEIELADERLGLREVAAILSDVTGRPVRFEHLDAPALIARSHHAGVVANQEWLEAVGYPAGPEAMRAHGLRPLPFRAWAERHALALVAAVASEDE